VRVIENMPLSERLAYWERELGRCIRCYACRNACPLCVCRESCIAETRDPHWMTQETTASEKMMFHMIHTLHLAGRCTECGECERACPMGISLMTLKKKINMDMLELFGYVAGTDPAGKPPLLTFKVDEERLEEHKV
jgi:ferredoxin